MNVRRSLLISACSFVICGSPVLCWYHTKYVLDNYEKFTEKIAT